ncbi:hypothetical protein [Clostridium beijerinckii]|uniref:Uncharacterized protein n=1 Tax=Clostridium beijerinckii TaxID=1520 RepID=A0AAE5H2S5_CLOBE|nr:hypothetical protein [Clostridium beijerinckii]ALB44599.1 hypothetical protein X276_04525 [Clostridium beijerinckii NRRL B-598]NSB13038.1 hypothetical protein [Clostridium beijerinckii]OOM22140.1 hypothetical protein CLOBE_44790 [Clostridium beijerinckii]
MSDKEITLKQAYNNYIDSLVSYIGEIKQNSNNLEGAFNNGLNYILDNSLEVGLRNSREYVLSGSTDRLLAKKVI